LYGKNESSIREVMKNKEKICASFSVAPQTAKVTAVAPDSVNEGGKSLKFLNGKTWFLLRMQHFDGKA